LYPVASCVLSTPLGRRFEIGVSEGAVLSGAFARRRPSPRSNEPLHPLLREAVHQLRAYFAKRLRRFDLPLHLCGTGFQCDAWRLVASLETGELISYADVARAIGRPAAARGVALAMRTTPLDLLVPAHRVVGSDGTVRGAGPRSMRRRLLTFEGIVLR